MEIVEVTWGRAFKVWWAVVWRAIVVSLVAGFAVGFVVGVIAAVIGVPAHPLFSAALGGLAGLASGIWAVKAVLYKRFSDFSVVLIANS